MKKIINYIANGQGIGLKYLALLALVLGIICGVATKMITTDAIPYAQQVADQLLPIKVIGGQIVEPEDTYKVVHIRYSDDDNFYPVPIVLDTTSDVLDINLLEQGVYITKSFLYLINENEARTYKLDGDFELEQKDYTDAFTSFINWTAFSVAIFVFAGLFVFYFLMTLLYSAVAAIIAALTKVNLDFNKKMRLSMVAFVTTLILSGILKFITGLNVGMWASVIVVVALQFYLIHLLKGFELPDASGVQTPQLPQDVVVKSSKESTSSAPKTVSRAKKKTVAQKKNVAAKTTKSSKKAASKSKAKGEVASEVVPAKKKGRKPKA